jgi:two-component system cell cycle response regulator
MPARMLLIEDNPTNLELMSYLLTAFGHTVVSLTEGRQAVEVARRERPDMVICDIQLPDVDGYDIARRMRQESSTRHIPSVAVTAYAMVGDREKALAAGFDGYISKPIDPANFMEQVQHFLPPEKRGSPQPVPVPPVQSHPPRPSRGTVLVVDDTPANLQLMQSLLEPSGFEVLVAETAEEAMAVARRGRPDLIVSDVHLAHDSGYELVASLKRDPELRSIPCIVISSTDTSLEASAAAAAAGAQLFVLRPVDPGELLNEIKSHIPCKEEARGHHSDS